MGAPPFDAMPRPLNDGGSDRSLEIGGLRARLGEAEDALCALCHGEVEAIVGDDVSERAAAEAALPDADGRKDNSLQSTRLSGDPQVHDKALSTVEKRLVEMHGGSVEATSDGEHRGSRVVVHLPAAGAGTAAPPPERAAPPLPPAPPVPTSDAATAGGCRVLVVEDNPDSADSMAMLLQLMGHDTAVAHDGEAAVREAAAFRPNVVLMDIGLPGVDGYEAARRIRATPGGSDLLLVALTGWGQEGDRSRSKHAGLDHHLVKPVDPERLAELLAVASRRS